MKQSDFAPDAVQKRVRNLKVGMQTTRWGEVLSIERQREGSEYFNVRYYAAHFSQPGDALVQVEVPEDCRS